MKILLIGSGARESAIAHAILRSPHDVDLHIAPSNTAMACFLKNITLHNIQDSDIESLVKLAQDLQIDLAIVGPETPLSLGIVDALESVNIKVFGPSKSAARLESSKIFMKDIVTRAGIPTAKYQAFTSNEFSAASDFIDEFTGKIVIKTDGLASGKGVVICEDIESAKIELREFFDGKFGDAGRKVVIEEFLEGYEVSFFAISDGVKAKAFSHACDYKQVVAGGPNTGGMGTYSPAPVSKEESAYIMSLAIYPLIAQMQQDGCPFVGFLFAGMMMTPDGPKVLEYNIRLGDPETQSILLRLDTDFVDVILSAIAGNICDIQFLNDPSITVVLASKGYPYEYQKGDEISLPAEMENTFIYPAGVIFDGKKLITNGGRVLSVSSSAKTHDDARKSVYDTISKIHFNGMHFRKDIGL